MKQAEHTGETEVEDRWNTQVKQEEHTDGQKKKNKESAGKNKRKQQQQAWRFEEPTKWNQNSLDHTDPYPDAKNTPAFHTLSQLWRQWDRDR